MKLSDFVDMMWDIWGQMQSAARAKYRICRMREEVEFELVGIKWREGK